MSRWDAGYRVYLICGCVFSGVGIFFLLVGLILLATGGGTRRGFHRSSPLLPLLCCFMGLLVGLLGIGLILWWRSQRRKKNRLIRDGYYVTADITGFPIDSRVTINGMPTYRVECCYRDPSTGIVHIFQSENILIDPAYVVQEGTVRVYVDPKSGFRDYVVDVDPILPEIRRH